MDLGLSQILNFERDPGDRNRTSPFAFTGNRFEFRAVGSSQSVSGPLITMNTMLADSLNWIAEKLEAEFANGAETADAVISVLKETDGRAWRCCLRWRRLLYQTGTKQAVKERGLKNIPTTADALPALREESVKELFESTGVLSPVELESRFEVYSEQYILSIEVEAKLVIDMAKTLIYPAAIRYLADLAITSSSLVDMEIDLDNSTAISVAAEANAMMEAVGKLSEAMEQHDFASTEEHMQFCAKTIRALMDEVRSHADALETEVADELWPLPKYQEMLFIK